MLRTKYVTFWNVEESIRKAFGLWLQSEREKTGVTQEQVAAETDLNVKSISRIERGESGTKRNTIVSIVDAINKLSHGYQINKNFALKKYGFSPDENTFEQLADEEFSALFLDSANWSTEAREDALAMAKDVFRRFQAREKARREKENE